MSNNPTPKEPTSKRVTSEEMCKRFNDGQYWERALSGELDFAVLESRPSSMLPNEVLPIESQMISISSKDGRELARAHRFLRSDGTIAASRKPDPKRLFDEETNTILRLVKKARPAK
jgi:hypothetical protein